MNQEIAHKDEKKAKNAIPFAIFMLLLSVLTLNLITLTGTLFCLLVLKQSYFFWKGYSHCIRLFYIISLATTAAETVCFLIAFIYFRSEEMEARHLREVQGKQYIDYALHNMRTTAILFCLSILEIILIIKVYKAIFNLYIEFADNSLLENSELYTIDSVDSKTKLSKNQV